MPNVGVYIVASVTVIIPDSTRTAGNVLQTLSDGIHDREHRPKQKSNEHKRSGDQNSKLHRPTYDCSRGGSVDGSQQRADAASAQEPDNNKGQNNEYQDDHFAKRLQDRSEVARVNSWLFKRTFSRYMAWLLLKWTFAAEKYSKDFW